VEGRERLRLLSEVMGAASRTLLVDVGLNAGAICLDAGCGGGDMTCELARMVGPGGRAVGVDLDMTKIEIAQREGDEQGLENIRFEVADVTDWEPDGLFDVVYARFLLTHLPNPGEFLAALRRHLRPGGVIIIEDIDFRGHFAEPECRALERYVEFYTKSVRARGGDPNIGPRLPKMLREAGFNGVEMRLHHPTALQGGIKLLTCVTLENIAEAVLKDGLTSENEFRETLEELYAFARDPHTVMGGPRVFQAWGRSGM
jgi:ubiquinone/menaquinone biosynthesis C-methylase UbiE